MARKPGEPAGGLSRRELFKRAGIVGASVAVPVGALSGAALSGAPSAPPQARAPAQTAPAPRREALETLTAAEMAVLEASVARLIPSDESGPGAAEARAAHYIDRALGGALASSLDAYRNGLDAIDRHARASRGAAFAQLAPADQDAVLRDVETDSATGFTGGAAAFFNLLRTHTIQGTFSDPYYGGNANFVGWDMLGYPGVRLAAGPAEQRLDAHPAPTHRSAYDHAMFSRRPPARAAVEGKDSHGD